MGNRAIKVALNKCYGICGNQGTVAGLFANPHLKERPDRGGLSIDFVGFTRAVLRGLLRQCG
jgi:hypothetical protein